jgi:acetyl-CoA decarbonylase/synthase complex subunit gamma
VRAAALYLAGFLAGALVTPVLLPWLPGRAFALKGASVGGVLALVYFLCQSKELTSRAGALDVGAWLFLLPAVSSFFAMNFTGATPYTSPSGVRSEVRVALPGQALAAALGLSLWLLSHFV